MPRFLETSKMLRFGSTVHTNKFFRCSTFEMKYFITDNEIFQKVCKAANRPPFAGYLCKFRDKFIFYIVKQYRRERKINFITLINRKENNARLAYVTIKKPFNFVNENLRSILHHSFYLITFLAKTMHFVG